MRTKYFMGIKDEGRKAPGEVMLERFPYPKKRLGRLVLEGMIAEAALMARDSPELLRFFGKMLLDTAYAFDPVQKQEASIALVRECLGSRADDTILLLARMLECDSLPAQLLAAKTLKAAKEEGADILFAVKALRRSLGDTELNCDTSTVLALHYHSLRDHEGMVWMLSHEKGIVNAMAANVLSLEAAKGDGFALDLLLDTCSDPAPDVRKNAATKLSHALLMAGPGAKAKIRGRIKDFKRASPLVYIDVMQELDIAEKLIAASGVC